MDDTIDELANHFARVRPNDPATERQQEAIRNIFASARLSPSQRDTLMTTLAGTTTIDTLTQAQATIILSAVIARGTEELVDWANQIARTSHATT